MAIEINLEPYGKEGMIVLDEPSFGRIIAGQDAMIGLCLTPEDLEKISKITDDNERGRYTQACLLKSPAKLSVLNTMCYVKSAPFFPSDETQFCYKEFVDNMTPDLYNNIRELVKANFKPINLMTE